MMVFIFPGQGSQFVGMGKDLCEKFPAAAKIFEEADKALGFSISKLCFDGPEDVLNKTENAQPAILTTSIAAHTAFEQLIGDQLGKKLKPSYVAGLSLGEYTALIVAGVLRFEDGVQLVRKRGLYMEEAALNNPGKMICILGLSREQVIEICKETQCEIANLNCPGQVVVSGTDANIDAAIGVAQNKGALRVIPLKVSGAFHCSLMQTAKEKLTSEIDQFVFNVPSVPVVSNVTAQGHRDIVQIKANLIKQVSCSTFWEDSVKWMISKGVNTFFEIGPGIVLKGLNRKIDSGLTTVNLGTSEQINKFTTEENAALLQDCLK